MRVLIAVKGTEAEGFFRDSARLVPLERASDVILAHVVDIGPRGNVEMAHHRFLNQRPLSRERDIELRTAEREHGRTVLQRARSALLAVAGSIEHVHEVDARGKPNEELLALAKREAADLVVVGGRGGKPGPHSIGKTARFLIDHAPRAVMVIQPT